MATNLLARGKKVVVYDRVSEQVKRLVGEGAAAADSPSEIAHQAQFVVTMLPERWVLRTRPVMLAALNGERPDFAVRTCARYTVVKTASSPLSSQDLC